MPISPEAGACDLQEVHTSGLSSCPCLSIACYRSNQVQEYQEQVDISAELLRIWIKSTVISGKSLNPGLWTAEETIWKHAPDLCLLA